MTIAFDYDGTWSLDPEAWREAERALARAGHVCIVVTNRPYTEEHRIPSGMVPGHMPIYYVGVGVLKKEAMQQKGVQVDVWVDDRPGCVEPQRILQDGDDAQL